MSDVTKQETVEAALLAEIEGLRKRIEHLEGSEKFLRGRRGALVIERDAYQAHVENLIAAIENDGKTSSLHDWNERMKRAVSDARGMAEGLRARATKDRPDV